MAVYVDDIGIPARVGGLSGRWSHLIADSQEELYEFAARLGLRRAWFQDPTVNGKPTPVKPGTRAAENWHYDVTASKRALAIEPGAVAVSWRDLHDIIDARIAAAHRAAIVREFAELSRRGPGDMVHERYTAVVAEFGEPTAAALWDLAGDLLEQQGNDTTTGARR